MFTDETKPYYGLRLCEVLRGFNVEGYRFKVELQTIFEVMRINPQDYADITFPVTVTQEWRAVLKRLDPFMTEGDM